MMTLPADFDAARQWLGHRLDTKRVAVSGDLHTEGEATPAAVLVPIIMHTSGATVLFTKRTEHLAKHAGQISFPGGRMEHGETAEAAALRETEEEVGLLPGFVTTVGRLAQYVTVTHYRVTPVVALVQPGFTLALQRDEVAEAFEVPLPFLLDPQNIRERELVLPERRVITRVIEWDGRVIWGATAGMVHTLYRTLSDDAV